MTTKEISKLSDEELAKLIVQTRQDCYLSDVANELYVKLIMEKNKRDNN